VIKHLPVTESVTTGTETPGMSARGSVRAPQYVERIHASRNTDCWAVAEQSGSDGLVSFKMQLTAETHGRDDATEGCERFAM
jgi:hypothetical protein